MIHKLNHNKVYILLFGLLFIFTSIYYVVNNNKSNVDLFFTHNDEINTLLEYEHKFNRFLSSKGGIYIFDELNKNITDFQNILKNLTKEAKESGFDETYIQTLFQVLKEFETKELWIERYKARKSFESNIISFILDRSNTASYDFDFNTLDKLNKIRLDLLSNIEHQNFENIDFEKVYSIKNNDKYTENFINQIKALQKSMAFQNKYLQTAKNKNIILLLKKAKEQLLKQRLKTKQKVFVTLNGLFLLVILFLFLFIWFYRKLSVTKDQLSAFKKAVEISDNVIVMTDKQSHITYANESFEKITGYSKDQVMGQNPSILKSGLQNEEFYRELNETIKQGKTWKGRFINKKKDGTVFYENASISPIFSKGELDGYLAIKLDVTESVLHAQELDELNKSLEEKIKQALVQAREKDKILMEQTKMAALGEMIGNIAHQWRQPLSVISTGISGMQVQKLLGVLDDNVFDETCKLVIKNAKYLSKTIDDFRNFIIGDSTQEHFYLKESIDTFLSLVETSRKKYDIKVLNEVSDEIQILGLRNELNQCLINLFNNSKDKMVEDRLEEKYIKISATANHQNLIITFHDNAGGVPEDIMGKIFEPYFTTKHQSIGTGLGLNMTYRLITEGMRGNIKVENEKIKIGDKEFFGAKFIINLPLDNPKEL